MLYPILFVAFMNSTANGFDGNTFDGVSVSLVLALMLLRATAVSLLSTSGAMLSALSSLALLQITAAEDAECLSQTSSSSSDPPSKPLR